MTVRSSLVLIARSIVAIVVAGFFWISVSVVMYGTQFERYINEPYSTILSIAILEVVAGFGVGLVAEEHAGILAAPFSGLAIATVFDNEIKGFPVLILAILVSGLAPLIAQLLSRLLWGKSLESRNRERNYESQKRVNSETEP